MKISEEKNENHENNSKFTFYPKIKETDFSNDISDMINKFQPQCHQCSSAAHTSLHFHHRSCC